MTDVLIIKFGGSCVSSSDIKSWINAIEQSTRPIVLVPGGGPFADTVKAFQARIGYDDEAAHHMAILAMEQFGRALVSLGERLVPAATEDAIIKAVEAGMIPVWMPAKLTLRAGEIGADWRVTCLIKQLDVPEGRTLDALSGAGVVDEGFVDLLHPATRVYVAGPSDLIRCGRRLADGGVIGREIAREIRMLDAAQ